MMLCGCSSGASGKLALSWQFADGRACADTGAASMSLTVDSGAAQKFRCDEGLVPAAVTLMSVSADGATVRVHALSTENASLYAGSLDLDALPSSATVTLYADQMR
jgi:hypothetical protein